MTNNWSRYGCWAYLLICVDHPGGEEIFVLEGDVRLGKDHLQAGDYLYTAPNNKHGVSSETGCVLLLVVPEEVEILARRDKTQVIHDGA